MTEKTYLSLEIYYHHEGQFDYVDAGQIEPEEVQRDFFTWMSHQTMPYIEGCMKCVYLWDFERWYEMRYNHKPTYWD